MIGFLFWTAVGAACATVYYNISHGRTSSSSRLTSSSSSSKKLTGSGV
jgi:hypothetical protein